MLAGGVLALPDDAAVLLGVGVALGGEAQNRALLGQADGVAQLGVLVVEHEGGDEARGDGAGLTGDDARVALLGGAQDAHAAGGHPVGAGSFKYFVFD